MAEENYTNFFDSYMKEYVLTPTPKMRAVLFALRSINDSLDLLFLKTQLEEFKDVDTIERKIRNPILFVISTFILVSSLTSLI